MGSKHASPPKRRKKYKSGIADAVAQVRAIRKKLHDTFLDVKGKPVNSAVRAKFAMSISKEQQDDLWMECRSAWVAMLQGQGDALDWDAVTEALNTALVLSERGFGAEFQGVIADALEHVFKARRHFDSAGEWAWTDEAAALVNEGIDVYGGQLEHALQADLMSAIAEVANRIEKNQTYKEAA